MYNLDHWGRSYSDNLKYGQFRREIKSRGKGSPLDHWGRSTHDNALYAQAKRDNDVSAAKKAYKGR